MICYDISLQTPLDNILLDEALFALAEQGELGASLRFWESPQTFIVLGRISKEADDLIMDKVKRDNIPVLRRASGGGTVVQGKGCLNYSVVLSKEDNLQINDLKQSYGYILGRVIESLRQLNISAEYLPISDLALRDSNKKFSGNAQKRGKKFVLHHGTILYDFNLDLIPRYLAMPKSIPDYRANRIHEEFVTNINISVKDFKNSLSESFGITERRNALFDCKNIFAQLLSKRKIVVEI